MKLNKKTIVGLLLMTTSNMVFAESYIGGAIGQSDLDVSGYDDATSTKVYGGFRKESFGVEAAYHNLGTFKKPTSFGDIETKIKGFEISGVGYIPLNDEIELFGKIGAFAWDVDSDLSNLNLTAPDSGTDLTYGFGGQYTVMQDLSLRVEYQKFTKVSDEDISTVSVGAAYRF